MSLDHEQTDADMQEANPSALSGETTDFDSMHLRSDLQWLEPISKSTLNQCGTLC